MSDDQMLPEDDVWDRECVKCGTRWYQAASGADCPMCERADNPHAACDARIKKLEAERDYWYETAKKNVLLADTAEQSMLNVSATVGDAVLARDAAESRLQRATEALEEIMRGPVGKIGHSPIAIARACLAEIRGEQ